MRTVIGAHGIRKVGGADVIKSCSTKNVTEDEEQIRGAGAAVRPLLH